MREGDKKRGKRGRQVERGMRGVCISRIIRKEFTFFPSHLNLYYSTYSENTSLFVILSPVVNSFLM
jgi:hypothetical protein